MIIGQSIYNVPVLTYLLEIETFSIVEYQLKCWSVANDAAPDCRIAWSGLEQRVMDKAINKWHGRLHTCVELMDNTLNICTEPQTSHFDWFYCFITLLRLRDWHTVKFLLALQGTAATHKARFDGLSDVKKSFVTKFFWHISAKNYQTRWHLANLLHTVKGPLIKTM